MQTSWFKSLRKPIPLRFVLVVPFVLQVVGTVALVGYLSYRSGQESVANLSHRLMDEVGDRTSLYLEKNLEMPHLINQLNADAIRLGTIPGFETEDPATLEKFFLNQLLRVPAVSTIAIANDRGGMIGSGQASPYPVVYRTERFAKGTYSISQVNAEGKVIRTEIISQNYDARTRPWYQTPKQAGRATWSPIYEFVAVGTVLGISAGLPVYAPSGELQGVLATDIRLDHLNQFLADLQISQSGKIFIIERSGLLVASSSNQPLFTKQAGKLERIKAAESKHSLLRETTVQLTNRFSDLSQLNTTQQFEIQSAATQHFVRVMPFRDRFGLDWFIVIVVPESEFMAEIQRNNVVTMFLCAGAFVAAIGLGFFTANRLSARISQLNQASQELAAGNLAQQLPINSPIAEVNGLAQSFNQMAAQLQHLFQIKLAAEATRQSEVQLHLITDSIAGCISYIDASQRYRFVNRTYETWFNCQKTDILGKTIQTVIGDAAYQRVQIYVERALAGETVTYEAEVPYQGGEKRVISAVLVPDRDEYQQVRGYYALITDISDRKHIENQLRKTEEWLHQHSRCSPSSVYTLVQEPDGQVWFEYVSSAVESIHEVTVEQALQDASVILNAMHPDDRAGYQAAVLESLQDFSPFSYQWRIITPSGQVKWLQGNSQPERRENGAIAWHGVVIDITDRKHADAALQQSQKLIEQITESTTAILYIYDLVEQRNVYVNRQIREILGYSAEEIQAMGNNLFANLVHPEDLPRMLERVEDCLITGDAEVVGVEYRMRHASGEWRWLQSRDRVFKRTATGMPLQMIGTAVDITNRKQLELALQVSEARLQRLAANIAGMLYQYVLNPDGSEFFSYLSPKCWEIYELEPEVLLQDCGLVWTMIHPADRERVRQESFRSAQQPERFDVEFRLLPASGCVRWVRAVSQPERQPDGSTVWDGLVLDITDRKAAELELQQAKEAAEAASRAKSLFLANMSHELRTPLNIILGFTQLLSGDTSLRSEQQGYIRIMYRSGDHLLHLINDILDLSKIEAGHITLENSSVDLIKLLDDLGEMFRQRATDKALQFNLDLAPATPHYILTDSSKLRQVLINLLNNAIKFTHQGSVTLRVKTGTIAAERTYLARETQQPDQVLIFEVEDTGVGIASAELATIFDAFTQAEAGKVALEGTGLGLTISRSIVNLMGGDLSVCSTVNQGSTFRFSIPLHLARSISPSPAMPNRPVIGLAPDQPVYRILVVDDQPDNRHLLVKLLTQIGLEVQAVENGAAAIAHWQQWHPHLIWMDMRMPEMDGFATTQEIRTQELRITNQSSSVTEKPPRTKIIALTAQASSDDRARALAAGCDDFVSKPIAIDLMFTKLATHLNLRYLYQAAADGEQPSDSSASSLTLQPASLQVMPPDWIVALHKATLNCDEAETAALIQQIPAEHAALSNELNRWLHDYRFDSILRLTQPDAFSH